MAARCRTLLTALYVAVPPCRGSGAPMKLLGFSPIVAMSIAVRRTGPGAPAFHLMAFSVVTLLVTDFVYGFLTLRGDFHVQVALGVGWITFYVLWGAAALHPSMRTLEQPAPERRERLWIARLARLTAASIVAR